MVRFMRSYDGKVKRSHGFLEELRSFCGEEHRSQWWEYGRTGQPGPVAPMVSFWSTRTSRTSGLFLVH